MFNRGWLWVLLGGFIEALWPCLAKLSGGMNDMVYTVLSLFFSILATLLLNFGLKHNLPIGASYAVWIGLGVAGTACADILFFGESLGIWAYFFIALIFAGVAGMNLDDDRKTD
ncbi:MAG: SMR family transporter [archaeon]|nr:SMR family transporter [archaeon]